MSVDWTTTDACEQCDEHSSGEAARGLHRAWHAVVAALMEAVRIPQLVGWLARRLEAEAGFDEPAQVVRIETWPVADEGCDRIEREGGEE